MVRPVRFASGRFCALRCSEARVVRSNCLSLTGDIAPATGSRQALESAACAFMYGKPLSSTGNRRPMATGFEFLLRRQNPRLIALTLRVSVQLDRSDRIRILGGCLRAPQGVQRAPWI